MHQIASYIVNSVSLVLAMVACIYKPYAVS